MSNEPEMKAAPNAQIEKAQVDTMIKEKTLIEIEPERIEVEGEELDLAGVYQKIWSDLSDGVKDRRHGFHTSTVATIENAGDKSSTTESSTDGFLISLAPRVRTVVLREATEAKRHLVFHTDARASKVEAIKNSGRIAFCFYDEAMRIQVLAEGRAHAHINDATARERWSQSKLWSRRCYLSQFAPGTKIDLPSSCLPEDLIERMPTEQESETGFANFAPIVTEVDRLEWLYLTSKGNFRANFQWNGREFAGSWIAP